MADSDILAKVRMRFDDKRNTADAKRRMRIDSVKERFPRIAEIESEIARLGAENIRAIFLEPHRVKELNNKLRQKFDLLEKEKAEIIRKNNIDKNYDENIYSCPICSDTGYLPGGARCSCFEQEIIDEAFPKDLSILKRECFDNFRLDYYPAENRDIMKRILGRAKRLCENFDNEEKGLVFIGKPGLGKTFLSNCIEGDLRKRSKTVLSVRAVKLFRLMEDIKFGREYDEEKQKCIYDADLLIIDDLGTENDSQLNSSFFDDILNERIGLSKKTVISSNYTMEELNKKYSSRFISRVTEHFIISRFIGADIRMMKL